MTKSTRKTPSASKTGTAKSATKAATSTSSARKTGPKSPPRKTAATAKSATGKSTAKTAPAKPAPAKKKAVAAPAPVAAPEPAAAAPKVDPVVVKSAAPTVTTEMRKEQLLDEVAKRSGAKRKDVKPIVEAALEVMGEALGEGQELNLKPLGKVKIARTKHVANGRVINLRLRQSIQVIKELEDTKGAAE